MGIFKFIFKRNEIKEKQIKDVYKSNTAMQIRKDYKNIPLYSESEMKDAIIDDSEDALNKYIGRQALNGYAGLYKNDWTVGKRGDGTIIKTRKKLVFETTDEDVEKRKELILKTQNRALLGKSMDGIFCKFTYDIKDQELFAIHVCLEKEYEENTIMEDCGDYGGIHFVAIENIDLCTDSRNTYYGNKIALLTPIEDEIYYEYSDDIYVGKRIFVAKIMYLEDVKTWIYLSRKSQSIKNNKGSLCRYLKELNEKIPEENYDASIEFLEAL